MALDSDHPAEIAARRRAGHAVAGGKILTANRLRDGAVVYLGRDGNWSSEIATARFAHNDEEEQALKDAGAAAAKANLVVDVQVIDTAVSDKRPLRLRELIRATGPTVRPDLARHQDW